MSGAFASLLAYCRSRGYPEPEPEVRFHPERRWRWDACWPDRQLAVEFHGGVWSGGRHTRGKGFEADQEKFATAAVMGWRLIPVTTKQLNAGLLWELLDREFAGGAWSDWGTGYASPVGEGGEGAARDGDHAAPAVPPAGG